MPAALLAFTRSYPTPGVFPHPLAVQGAFAVGGVFAALSIATPLIVYDVSVNDTGLSRKAGALYPAFSGYFLLVWGAAFAVFARKWWHSSGIARAQLQYLGAGLVLPVAGGVSTNLLLPLLTGRSTYSWIGPYFTLFFVVIVGHAIIRHRLMDLRLVVHRGLAQLLVIGVVSGAAIGIARLGVTDWSHRWFSIQSDVLIVAIVALIMLSAPAQRLAGRVVDPYLYRRRIEHESALRDATQRLSRLMQPAEVAEEVKDILNTAFIPESFAMAARPLEGGPLEELSAGTTAIADLLTVAALMIEASTPSVLVVNPAAARGPKRLAHEALSNAGIEVVITLARRDQLLGAVLLGPRRSGDAYFIKDLNFIESVAQLASIALENALLYRHRIQMLEYSDRLLESLDSAVVAVNESGRITSFNPAATALLGLDDKARDSTLAALPSEVGWGLALALSSASVPRDIELLVDHEARGPLPVILSTAVLHDHRGQVSGALVVVTDLSTVKALERNERRVEHFAMMARFYAGIAHEIRSPLAAISNFISMLPDRFEDPEYRDTAIRLLPHEVARIVRLADRLRLMAPSEDGKLNSVALPPLLADIVAIHGPSAQDHLAKVVLQCSDDLPRILADPAQLVQLFVNLLKNAIESMPDGGTVTIDASRVTSRTGHELVVVRVTDDGIGIDQSVRSKIFQPFFTTKPAGTGLGLSICREIANFHRARLVLLPRRNARGTTAQVEFPCASASGQETDGLSVLAPHRTPLRR